MKKITIWLTDGGQEKIDTSGFGPADTVSGFLQQAADRAKFRELAIADAANSDQAGDAAEEE